MGEDADFVFKNEEEAKYRLRVEIGELLHALTKQNPDLRGWADSVQDCVYGMLEGETKDSCAAVYREHIGDETKHVVWRIVERIRFMRRCEVIANQEVDESIARLRIKIYDYETAVLLVASSSSLLYVYLPAIAEFLPIRGEAAARIANLATAAISIAGIFYSALTVWLKRRSSPAFLGPWKKLEVDKRKLACLNGNMPGILSEIQEIKEGLNRRLSG